MRILLGALVGAILAYVVGFVAWGVMQVHAEHINAIPNEAQVVQAVSGAKRGLYVRPAWPPKGADKEAQDAYVETYEKGPLIYMVVNPDGGDTSAMWYVKGFGINFVCALLAALLVARIGSFFGRWLSVIGIAAFATIYHDGNNWTYWFTSQEWMIRMFATHIGTWAVGGLGIALIAKPKTD